MLSSYVLVYPASPHNSKRRAHIGYRNDWKDRCLRARENISATPPLSAVLRLASFSGAARLIGLRIV